MSLIRWSFEALCINEFTGLSLKPQGQNGMLSVNTGEQVLASLGCDGSSVIRALKYQAAIIGANYLFTLISLLLQKPSFEKIQVTSPPPSQPSSSLSRTSTTVVESSSNASTMKTVTMKPPML